MEKYKELAEKYDQTVLDVIGYPDPNIVAETLQKMGVDKSAPILDFGCGTGLIGMYAKDKGYNNLIGVDASKDMIERAQQDRGYTELKELFLGSDQFPAEFENRFEVAVS